MELSTELFFEERLDLRVIFFINSEPCFFLRSLQNRQGHFEVNIFRENLLYFSLNAMFFVTWKVVNVVGIFNFATDFRGWVSRG